MKVTEIHNLKKILGKIRSGLDDILIRNVKQDLQLQILVANTEAELLQYLLDTQKSFVQPLNVTHINNHTMLSSDADKISQQEITTVSDKKDSPKKTRCRCRNRTFTF